MYIKSYMNFKQKIFKKKVYPLVRMLVPSQDRTFIF